MTSDSTLLNPDRIVQTVDRLVRRIRERFPDSSLGRVGERLLGIALQARDRSRWIGRPILGLRLGIAVLLVILVAGLLVSVANLPLPRRNVDLLQFVQVLESGINDVVYVAVAIFFLVTLETRIKRKRALDALHELRSVAHVIDMHQLTKDPERVLPPGPATPSSPTHTMSPFELRRYLDYCSEMLSLTGKMAALYVQSFNDLAALGAVRELEDLTTGLSRKVWQKIMILHSFETLRGNEPPATPRPGGGRGGSARRGGSGGSAEA